MVPALVVALATAMRFAWVLLVPTKPVGDFAMYLESAVHLVEHGALDPEFVYMPGYVLVLAAVQALGGGVLAAKLVGAALGGLGAGAVYGIAHHLWDRRVALAASLMYALWPAGIAVSSVTGTDLPTAVLVGVAGWCLVRWGARRPWLGALAFGVAMGVAAWMRAVALPLALFSAFYFWTQGQSWRAIVRHTAIACVAAGVMLAPWGVRNRLRYGETFLTDSHGGLTALVGANPNSDGAYSRSLNRVFFETTGYKLLAEPHRQADRAAYQMARDWTAFEPWYAAALVVTKAERLLANERPLLYWPLFRAGVLKPPQKGWFEARRKGIETVVDAFWGGLVVLAFFGLAIAVARRRWAALTFVPIQLALVGIYALFFAETRYQLPIVLLLFPPAGAGLVWIGETTGRLWRERRRWPELSRELGFGLATVMIVLVGWPTLVWAGARVRENHRWAAHVCHVGGQARVCKWRREGGAGPSGVRGVWNGVGVAAGKTAMLALSLPAGHYRVRGLLDGRVEPTSLQIAGTTPPVQPRPDEVMGQRAVVDATVDHGGGPLMIRLQASDRPAVWLSDLKVDSL